MEYKELNVSSLKRLVNLIMLREMVYSLGLGMWGWDFGLFTVVLKVECC